MYVLEIYVLISNDILINSIECITCVSTDTETISIRLPGELVEKIDHYIELLGHFQTRPAYIVNSMEVLFRSFVGSRLKVDAEIEKLRETAPIDSEVIRDITRRLVSGYMEKYEVYGGENIQILLRVPCGLSKDIDDYANVLGFYSKKSDFIRMAVINQISADESFVGLLSRVKDHKVQQRRSSDEIVQAVLQNISKDQESINGMVSFINAIAKESKTID